MALLLLPIIVAPLLSLAYEPAKELFSPTIPHKVLNTFQSLPQPIQYPEYTDTIVGDWLYFPPDTFTSGFFPATAYALNTRSLRCPDGIDWLSIGRASAAALVPLETKNTVGHAVGFLSYPFAEEISVNPENKTAIDVLNAFASDLAARFDPVVGCTRSWDSPDPVFQVIIENMMTMELLFQSAALTGNRTLTEIAMKHADTTMANHIRPDGSTWQLVEYNTFTGAIIGKLAVQGYSSNSTWSRGQAWGLYGFTKMYFHTQEPRYLDTARRLANYFIENIPDDGIIPWDFNAPLIPAPRPADSSAAMVAANGLLMLSRLETKIAASKKWRDAAIKIINPMIALAWRPSWQSLLANGTVNEPGNNSMTGTVYGDYFFIEAGNALLEMGLAACG